MTGLDASVGVTRGAVRVDARLTARPGRITAVLGPNGAGKSTVLDAIAGIEPLESGRIVLDGAVLDDPAADVFVPPERRRIGVVFQDLLLFPHLTVRENVAFGPRSRREADADERARSWLERLGVGELADRRATDLSGGQAQRVAMARALAADPALLLLDEPLAALDATTRLDVRRELRHHLAEFAGTTLLVTHDPLDALVLADDVTILEDGRVTQQGPIAEVAQRPATPYVASLLGVNLLHAVAADGLARMADGAVIALPDQQLAGDVLVVLRPEAITLHTAHPEGSARNVWPVTVRDIEPQLDRMMVHVTGPPDLAVAVTAGAATALGLAPGTRMWASAKALDLEAYARPL